MEGMLERMLEGNTMKCINLCEILSILFENKKSMDDVIDKLMAVKDFDQCNRFYIGSYFCSQYFLYMKEEDISKLVHLLNARDKKLTLVIPIVTEKYLDKCKEKIKRILYLIDMINKELCDEVTVNDYGMLQYMYANHKQKLNLGRLFMKDYRDPRHEDYFLQTYETRVFTNYMKAIINHYRIKSCEWDLTHEILDLSSAPCEIQVAVHRPYSYMTVGQICELGSISKDVSKKYRPNEPCKKECELHYISYDFNMDMEWMKYGRALYYNNNSCKYISNNTTREIYFPLSEVVQ